MRIHVVVDEDYVFGKGIGQQRREVGARVISDGRRMDFHEDLVARHRERGLPHPDEGGVAAEAPVDGATALALVDEEDTACAIRRELRTKVHAGGVIELAKAGLDDGGGAGFRAELLLVGESEGVRIEEAFRTRWAGGVVVKGVRSNDD